MGLRQADLEMDFRRWSEMDEETYRHNCWRWRSKVEVMVNDDDGGDGDDADGGDGRNWGRGLQGERSGTYFQLCFFFLVFFYSTRFFDCCLLLLVLFLYYKKSINGTYFQLCLVLCV
ncbi:hypothetical protein SLEP1_g51638 [Rubroshorea leprosula]|uniref:Transmembrane protein n=1 Tax=Rubroshorea leprosula TaxID=152421 RepID=A0AAV5M3W7_9ROSI|nr:hypothetical protein SLEP1_g51638 [Rubroshorea leprosula]